MVSNMLFGDTMKGQLSPSQKRIWAPPGSTECGFPLGDERSPGPHFSVTTSDKSAFLAAGGPRTLIQATLSPLPLSLSLS